MKPSSIKRHPGFDQPWYYKIELAPDLYTPGKQRMNVALTRRLLSRVEIGPGVRCLDVGIQEGLVSILLDRRGAEVVAYDRVFSRERLGLVREALDASFDLIGESTEGDADKLWRRGRPTPGTGMPLSQLPNELAARGRGPFDVVVFSGVLYHVYDPLAALALMRGLVRTGGILIVETAAVFDDNLTLNLNGANRFAPLAIWLPSLGCLDYLLRLVRLDPIDVVYRGRERGRIAVACRAVDDPSAEPDDDFIASPLHDYELAEYLDWPAIASDDPPVPYADPGGRRVGLFEAVRDGSPHRPEADQMRLDLDART